MHEKTSPFRQGQRVAIGGGFHRGREGVVQKAEPERVLIRLAINPQWPFGTMAWIPSEYVRGQKRPTQAKAVEAPDMPDALF